MKDYLVFTQAEKSEGTHFKMRHVHKLIRAVRPIMMFRNHKTGLDKNVLSIACDKNVLSIPHNLN